MSGSLGIELSVAQSDLAQALSVLLLGKKLHSRSFSAKNYTKILGRVVQSAKTCYYLTGINGKITNIF